MRPRQQGMSSKPATSAGGDACNTQNQQNNTASPGGQQVCRADFEMPTGCQDCNSKCSKEMGKPECGSIPGNMLSMCSSLLIANCGNDRRRASSFVCRCGSRNISGQGCGGKPPQIRRRKRQPRIVSPNDAAGNSNSANGEHQRDACGRRSDRYYRWRESGWFSWPTDRAGGSGSPGSATITQLAILSAVQERLLQQEQRGAGARRLQARVH